VALHRSVRALQVPGCTLTVALSMSVSQEGNGVSLLMDYDEELSDVGI